MHFCSTIARWLKKEGESLKAGDALAEVETDKATVTFDMTDDAVLARILRAEGSADVPVGSIIAITVEDAADVAAFKDFKLEEAAPAPAAAAPAAPAPAAAPKPAAPVAAAAAAPAPKPAAPAPAPAAAAPKAAPAPAQAAAPAAAASGPYIMAFESWGQGLARSPLGASIAKQQNAYASAFGYTGFDPLPQAEDEKKSKEKPAK